MLNILLLLLISYLYLLVYCISFATSSHNLSNINIVMISIFLFLQRISNKNTTNKLIYVHYDYPIRAAKTKLHKRVAILNDHLARYSFYCECTHGLLLICFRRSPHRFPGRSTMNVPQVYTYQ